ncbi:MAG: helix-turn-helix transcriptional regulator [Victivallaceae bacterium]|jgi:transcriptional regulator with XRE-family HTH domain
MNSFKERLKFYMLQAGLNPTSLSKKARLNVTAVRDILEHTGTPNPRIDTFAKLCQALGVSPHQLSPEFEKLYSPRQRNLLDEISDLDDRDRQLQREIDKLNHRKGLNSEK